MAKKNSSSVYSYFAHASVKAKASAAAIQSAYKIEVRFLGGLTSRQQSAFEAAADRWTKVIVGDLPSVTVEGEVIDDLLILAQGEKIDGPGNILGQAGPTHLRPAGSGPSSFLPARGIMSFDTDDLEEMQRNGTLEDVITHEMGHVIGIGTIWTKKRLLKGGSTNNPTFAGATANKEYGALKGVSGSVPVPVENTGGPGTRNGHWRETVFRNELMSGFIESKGNPLSRVTVGSLKDMGYEVDMSKAEPFGLPNLLAIAEAGLLTSRVADMHTHAHTIPVIPMTLPKSSLKIE